MSNRLCISLALVPILVLAGCGGTSPREETVYINSYMTECTTMVVQLCMLTRSNSGVPWSLFYNGINGFQYSWGSTYKVTVRIDSVANPPADAPSETYSLVGTAEASPVVPTTTFQIPVSNGATSLAKSPVANVYRMYQAKDFICQQADCDAIDLARTQALGVLLEFDYQNQPSQPLHLLRIACAAPASTFRATCT